MRTERVVESRFTDLRLTESQAEGLGALGQRLASKKEWWGARDQETPAAYERTVIRVEPGREGSYRVRVADAVGMIVVQDLQLLVEPKIPMAHLLYLFERSGRFPRLEIGRSTLQRDNDLSRLVREWLVLRAHEVVRRGLLRDYREQVEETLEFRGRVNELSLARHFFSGTLGAECSFDEYDYDSPMNRVLRGGTVVAANLPGLSDKGRSYGRIVLRQTDDVGVLRPGDRPVTLERRAAYYRDAILLAEAVLEGEGRALAGGKSAAWTFLIKTPDLVEDGLRHVLEEELGKDVVQKRGLFLDPSLSVNPDLVFYGNQAVADVKYKIAKENWGEARSDLYEVVAFGQAFGAPAGAIARFTVTNRPALRPVRFGDIKVSELLWNARESVDPEAARHAFVVDCKSWIARVTQRP